MSLLPPGTQTDPALHSTALYLALATGIVRIQGKGLSSGWMWRSQNCSVLIKINGGLGTSVEGKQSRACLELTAKD